MLRLQLAQAVLSLADARRAASSGRFRVGFYLQVRGESGGDIVRGARASQPNATATDLFCIRLRNLDELDAARDLPVKFAATRCNSLLSSGQGSHALVEGLQLLRHRHILGHLRL